MSENTTSMMIDNDVYSKLDAIRRRYQRTSGAKMSLQDALLLVCPELGRPLEEFKRDRKIP